MCWILTLILITHARAMETDPSVLNQIQETRASISEDERRQREALSLLYTINKKVQIMAHKQTDLRDRMLSSEGNVRSLAMDVAHLEERAEKQKALLNRRLRQLYQDHSQSDMYWIFSAQSPVELDRNHRFLQRMIDSDHRKLKEYLTQVSLLAQKRSQLKKMVAKLMILQKSVLSQEQALVEQLKERSVYLNQIKLAKDVKISKLTGLRDQHRELNSVMYYSFFEKRGQLRPPVEVRPAREYGTYVDPKFRFRLAQKGLFYALPQGSQVRAVFSGHVVFANALPGFGKTVIVNHEDNYYSVYAFASALKVREGMRVKEADVVALSGQESPLFGPGLYFEIRHFTDAIDPRSWIKDSVIQTADREEPL